MTLEPIGDPDEAPGSDFADEHAQTVVDPDESDEGESESPGTFAGGMEDGDGPP
jgi:hypothetical protein